MRKIYFLLMAAITLTMSAFNNAEIKNAVEADLPNAKVIRQVAKTAKAPVATAENYESETWTSLGAGKYISTAIADCYGGSTDLVDVEIFEAQGKKGLYKVVGVWPDILNGGGTIYVDATDPDFVLIKDQDTGIVDKVDGETHIASLTSVLVSNGYTKEKILAELADINITLKDNVITIPEGAVCLNWPNAPDDSSYKTDPAKWYSYGENEGVVVLPGGEYVDPWGEAVDATMVETILGPTFGNTNTAPYTIQIQKNSETGVYRLISPWRQLYTDLGLGSSTAPNLDIDASDPTNLIIPLQATGLGGKTDGAYGYMSTSYYDLVNEQETEDALKITLTDNGDGTSTISFPYRSGFIYAQTSGGTYYASNYADVLSYVTFPTFSGINEVKADIDNSNAPVEYFNLQGMRIAAPVEGQLVIKRQGSKVEKLI
ncbi:MAG: hypothetical protein PUD26_08000, partial [bacterium]|nr:hypothetical protein [bacterium]